MASYFELKQKLSTGGSQATGSTGKTKSSYFDLKKKVSPVIESNVARLTAENDRKRKEEAIRKSQEDAQKYQAEANSVSGKVGEFIFGGGLKNLAKDVVKGAVVRPAISLAEVPLNVFSGGKKTFGQVNVPGLGNIESYQNESGRIAGEIVEGQKPLRSILKPIGESVLDVGSLGVGGQLVKQGAKQGMKIAGKAIGEGALYGAGYGTTESLGEGKNLKESAKTIAIGTALGGILGGAIAGAGRVVGKAMTKSELIKSGKLNKTISELEDKGIEITDKEVNALEEAFMDGADENKIIENIKTEETPVKREPKKLKAGEFAPISKEIQETTGKKLTAKETLEVKDKIEQGYTKEEIIADLTTPKRTELTSKPLKTESKVSVPKEEIKAKKAQEFDRNNVEKIRRRIAFNEKLGKETISKLEETKLGVDELKFDKDGNIKVWRDGEVIEGRPQGYSLTEKTNQKPYIISKNDIIANFNSKKFDDLYKKVYKGDELSANLETLNRFRNLEGEILVKKPEKTKIKKEKPNTKPETPKMAKTGESITAKKLNEVMPDEYKINEDYDKITLKGELDRASKEIAKDQDEALRKAFSRDERVDRRIAKLEEFSQISKENKDYEAVNRLFTQANKIGTETAQGLNMLKALYAVNPEYKYMQDVINARLGKIKVGVNDIEKATKEVREMIVKKSKDLKEKTKQAFKVKDAQELLNSIMCK